MNKDLRYLKNLLPAISPVGKPSGFCGATDPCSCRRQVWLPCGLAYTYVANVKIRLLQSVASVKYRLNKSVENVKNREVKKLRKCEKWQLIVCRKCEKQFGLRCRNCDNIPL
ncbi:MAG: hypothetical protein IJ523_03030 [Succinivibrionaceae bacterium]|nr:hypothetical protein [Succinivibrionaceae bacterium]